MPAAGSPPPVRGGALDLIRFAAAAFVVVYHMGPIAPTPLAELHPALGRGYLATDLFLMLSGYVLARIYGGAAADGRMAVGPFLWKRLLRIGPPHVIVLLGFAAMVATAAALGVTPSHPENFQPRELLLQLTLTQAWGVPNAPGWNLPTWTLSALLPCYALFIPAYRALAGIRPWLGLALAFGLLLAADGLVLLSTGETVNQLPHWLGVVRAVPLFLLGLAVARAGMALPSTGRIRIGLALAGAVLLAASQAFAPLDLLAIVALGLVIVGCDTPAMGRAPLVARLAEWSFAVFLVHTPALGIWSVICDRLAPSSGAAQWLLWSGGFFVSLIGAALFSAIVDRPLAQALRTEGRTSRPSLQRALERG